MAHTELDLRKRRAIEDMLNAKMPELCGILGDAA